MHFTKPQASVSSIAVQEELSCVVDWWLLVRTGGLDCCLCAGRCAAGGACSWLCDTVRGYGGGVVACEKGVLSANGDCAPINGELSTDWRGVLGADCCDRTEAGVLTVECDLSEVGVPGTTSLEVGSESVSLVAPLPALFADTSRTLIALQWIHVYNYALTPLCYYVVP